MARFQAAPRTLAVTAQKNNVLTEVVTIRHVLDSPCVKASRECADLGGSLNLSTTEAII